MRDRRRLITSIVGAVAVGVPLWGAIILGQWTGFKRNVLDYKGLHPRDGQWGIIDFARHAHNAQMVNWLVGPGRFVSLAVSALVPAFLVLRRRDALAAGVGLSLALFLLATTNFGTQYLAWAAAGVLLLDVWAGSADNLIAGLFLVVTYTHWANGFPWYEALSKRLTPAQERLGWLVWCVLLLCVVLGIRRLWRWPKAPRDADDQMSGIGSEATRSTVPIA